MSLLYCLLLSLSLLFCIGVNLQTNTKILFNNNKKFHQDTKTLIKAQFADVLRFFQLNLNFSFTHNEHERREIQFKRKKKFNNNI